MLGTFTPSPEFSELCSKLRESVITQGYRRRNVRQFLANSNLSQIDLSRKLGYSNSTFLGQMLGTNPIRPISEKTARKIEEAYSLSHLSLDAPVEFTCDDLMVSDVPQGYETLADISDTDPSSALAAARRKYNRVDYSSYRVSDTGVATYAQPATNTSQQPQGMPVATVLELLQLVESSGEGLPDAKLFKILKMAVNDFAKKSELDTGYVQSLIELIK